MFSPIWSRAGREGISRKGAKVAKTQRTLKPGVKGYARGVTYGELIAIARRFEGKTLETITGREFRVGIYMDCPFFVPASTRLGRSDGRAAAEKFLDIYNATGSIRQADYSQATRNASYLLALIHAGE